MLTTTPFLRPVEGLAPTPVISRLPFSLISPITAHTLVEPISSPTNKSSLFRGNLLLVIRRHSGTEIYNINSAFPVRQYINYQQGIAEYIFIYS